MINEFFQNTRKPEGLGGKLMVQMMNKGHAALAQWGFSHVNMKGHVDALDIGCGGGANLAALLRMFPSGTVTGMDYSAVSVEKSLSVNRDAVSAGRCRVLKGDASALPFEKESFDLVTAFETIYFWPELASSFRQIRNILRPGGMLLICNETDNAEDDTWTKRIDGMRIYSRRQLEQLLTETGFCSIQSDELMKKGWLCITAFAGLR